MHIGGLRTALYNYLFAKKNNGKLILRIEDTDQKRLVKDSIDNIVEALTWAGIDFDEGPHIKGGKLGPYIQSDRLDIYKKHMLELIEAKHAYVCFLRCCSGSGPKGLTVYRERRTNTLGHF